VWRLRAAHAPRQGRPRGLSCTAHGAGSTGWFHSCANRGGDVHAWHDAGHSQRAIARELNIDRRKVKSIIVRPHEAMHLWTSAGHDSSRSLKDYYLYFR
jgi:hypothetical protein